MRIIPILPVLALLAAVVPAAAQEIPTTDIAEPVLETVSVGGVGGREIRGFMIDPDGNGIVDATESEAVRQFRVASSDCSGLIVSNLSVDQITDVKESDDIKLMMVCADPDGLESAERAAIAANSVLMNKLAAAGFGLSNVAGIVLEADGRGTLYLSAS